MKASSWRAFSARYGGAVSIALLLLLWAVVSAWLNDRTLPTPAAVLSALITEASSGELFFHLGMTLLRVVLAFILAMSLGSALGLALGLHRQLDRWADPWLVLLLNLPALVVIVLSYIWFGLNEAAAVGAVALNKLPNVIVTIREGARSLSRELDEMAQVYQMDRRSRLRHVILPQLQPYFAAATRSGIALIWKIVLVVELLGRSNGVGFQIHLYFQLFDVSTILAYTLAFVVIMLLVEMWVLKPLDRHARRWRVHER